MESAGNIQEKIRGCRIHGTKGMEMEPKETL